jgi:crotonobetainyl-CoA:carnitine CoA-transferase CaiB-like acyl-CoA transferase
VPHPEKSGLFLHLNTNKESVTLNLKLLRGRQLFMQLVAKADVVVENFHPRVMPALGLAYPDLRPANTRLLMTSVSNFGQTGPYRDWRAQDLTLYGWAGRCIRVALLGVTPLKQVHNLTLYQGGAVAATATMVGLMGVRRHGVGQHVDVSLFETQAGSIDRPYDVAGSIPVHGRQPGHRRPPASGHFTCRNLSLSGWVC